MIHYVIIKMAWFFDTALCFLMKEALAFIAAYRSCFITRQNLLYATVSMYVLL